MPTCGSLFMHTCMKLCLYVCIYVHAYKYHSKISATCTYIYTNHAEPRSLLVIVYGPPGNTGREPAELDQGALAVYLHMQYIYIYIYIYIYLIIYIYILFIYIYTCIYLIIYIYYINLDQGLPLFIYSLYT